jgi:hypothetical protein
LVYADALILSPDKCREALRLTHADFIETGWRGSFGGPAWGNVAHASLEAAEALREFTERPHAKQWTKVIQLLNVAINTAHNSGAVLTKWISTLAMTVAANVPGLFLASPLVYAIASDPLFLERNQVPTNAKGNLDFNRMEHVNGPLGGNYHHAGLPMEMPTMAERNRSPKRPKLLIRKALRPWAKPSGPTVVVLEENIEPAGEVDNPWMVSPEDPVDLALSQFLKANTKYKQTLEAHPNEPQQTSSPEGRKERRASKPRRTRHGR